MLFIKEDSLFEIGGILSAQKGYYLEKYLPREQASNAGGFDSKILKEAETEAGIWHEQMEVWEGTFKAESFDKENLQLQWQFWLCWLQNCIWNEETVKLYKATLCWQRIYWVAVGIVIKFSLLQFCNYKLFSKSVGR